MYAHDSILRGEAGDTTVSVAKALLAADPGTYHAAITPSGLSSDALDVLDDGVLNSTPHCTSHEQNLLKSEKFAALIAFMVQSEEESLTTSIRAKNTSIHPHIDLTTIFRHLGWSLRTDKIPASRTFHVLNHTENNPRPTLPELYNVVEKAKQSETFAPLTPVEQRRGDIVLFNNGHQPTVHAVQGYGRAIVGLAALIN